MKRENIFGLALAAIALFLLWLMNKKGLLHESVSAKIGGATVTTAGTILPDEFGFPVYDTRYPSTVPETEAFAIAPIDTNGNITQFPKNPRGCTCPIGFSKWRNAADSSLWCLPDPTTGTASGVSLVSSSPSEGVA